MQRFDADCLNHLKKGIKVFNKKFISFILILTLILTGWYYFYASNSSSAQVKPKFAIEKVAISNIEDSITASGLLEPRESVNVGAQVSGQIQDIYVEIGQSVKEGQLLAKIDARVYEARVEALMAQIKAQQYQLEDKEAQRELAKLTYERQKSLYEQNATDLQTYQNTEQDYKSAIAAYNILKAQIEQNESTLKAESTNLQYTKIYAPMHGTIVSIVAKKGQTLNANQQTPTILTIADLSTMTVRAEVAESDIMHIKKGMKVYFKTLGSEKKWYSTVNQIEPTPTITNKVVLYNVLFNVKNNDSGLMTSMTAQSFFVKAREENVLVVPISALIFTKDKSKDTNTAVVKVVLKDGNIEERKVTIGIKNRISAQIVNGLIEGEEVVTSNIAQEKRGQNNKQTSSGVLNQSNNIQRPK